jgi:DNA-binding transcriptional regulator YdaS (Cro superfamily)
VLSVYSRKQVNIPFEIDEFNRTRRRAGEPVMTQKRLAELAGVRPETVSRHVQGHFDIAPETLEAYRRALRLEVGVEA